MSVYPKRHIITVPQRNIITGRKTRFVVDMGESGSNVTDKDEVDAAVTTRMFGDDIVTVPSKGKLTRAEEKVETPNAVRVEDIVSDTSRLGSIYDGIAMIERKRRSALRVIRGGYIANSLRRCLSIVRVSVVVMMAITILFLALSKHGNMPIRHPHPSTTYPPTDMPDSSTEDPISAEASFEISGDLIVVG